MLETINSLVNSLNKYFGIWPVFKIDHKINGILKYKNFEIIPEYLNCNFEERDENCENEEEDPKCEFGHNNFILKIGTFKIKFYDGFLQLLNFVEEIFKKDGEFKYKNWHENYIWEKDIKEGNTI